MSERTALTIRAFRSADEDCVLALWHACGLLRQWNDPRENTAGTLRARPACAGKRLEHDRAAAL